MRKCGYRPPDYTKIHFELRKRRIPPILRVSRRELLSPPTWSRWVPWSSNWRRKSVVQTCTFLTKIPLEIRFLIYRYAIGDANIHIIELPRRMAHIECSFDLKDYERLCIPASCMTGDEDHPSWSDEHFGGNLSTLLSRRLSLLQTCQQIYAEAAPVLYTTNNFDFAHPESFNFFVRTIMPARLAMIRSASIGFYIFRCRNIIRTPSPVTKYNPSRTCNLAEDWDPMWNTIKTGMPSLRHLFVVVQARDVDIAKRQEFLVEPIKGLVGLKTFQLEIRHQLGPQTIDQYFLMDLLPSTVSIVQDAVKPIA